MMSTDSPIIWFLINHTDVYFVVGVAQGVVTGIRGLCNGLGPALYGFIFYLFNVDLNDKTATIKGSSVQATPSNTSDDHTVCISTPITTYVLLLVLYRSNFVVVPEFMPWLGDDKSILYF